MIKIILLSLTLTFSFTSLAKNEVEFYRLSNDIFGYLKLDQWIDYVKRIKTEDEIPTYYNAEVLTQERINYYKKFDIIGYESGLKKQIIKNISFEELKLSHDKLKNPFISKILNILISNKETSYNFSRRVLLARDEIIDIKRMPLIESIFNLLGYKAMADHMFETLVAQEKQDLEIKKILQKDNNDNSEPIQNSNTIKKQSVKKVFHVQINSALKNIKVNELRQFVALLKDKNLQKLVAVFNTYDYFFIYKFNRMLYKRSEQDIKRGLKSKTK